MIGLSSIGNYKVVNKKAMAIAIAFAIQGSIVKQAYTP
jgi:hypothetical protein